jgi:deoxyribonuclease IV
MGGPGRHRAHSRHPSERFEKDLGSRVDRHEHIGQGYIGTQGFELLLNDRRLAKLPMVLETPKDDDADARNLATLRNLIH